MLGQSMALVGIAFGFGFYEKTICKQYAHCRFMEIFWKEMFH